MKKLFISLLFFCIGCLHQQTEIKPVEAIITGTGVSFIESMARSIAHANARLNLVKLYQVGDFKVEMREIQIDRCVCLYENRKYTCTAYIDKLPLNTQIIFLEE